MGRCTPAKPLWSEVMIFLEVVLRQGSPLQEETASSDEPGAHRKWWYAREISSGERMFAGGEGIVRGLNPAKPLWSEVIVFLGDFLRQRSPLQEDTASSDEPGAHRKWWYAREISSGERMFAGGEGIVRGLTPAKPLRSEVIVILGDFLRRGTHLQEIAASSDERYAHRKTVIYRRTHLRQANAGRR